MKTTVFDKPQFVEGLTIRVAPEDVEKYLQIEKDVWFDDLATLPGFLGCETWISETNPGEVTQFYFWESEEAFLSVPEDFAEDHKRRTNEAIDNVFVKAWHAEDKRYRLRVFE